MKKIITISIASVFSFIVIAYSVLAINTAPVGDGQRKIDFTVTPGMSSSKAIQFLKEHHLIKSSFFFKLKMRLMEKASKLKVGQYSLNDGMNAGEVINIITSGKTKMITVTIPEGYNNRQIGDVLVAKGFFTNRNEFLEHAKDTELLLKYNIRGTTSEGYLFPETYKFPEGYPKKQIIETMIKLFQKKTRHLKGLEPNNSNRHKKVILASIVEREAKLKSERALIAGVFSNRLKNRQPLESCATVQYLFEKPRVRLYYKDLEIKSPYNTYKNRGLPPGPIANPGLATLEAAVNPQKTEYNFFVVKGNDGSHYFSKSFVEHSRAKKKYILR